jgi:hypothetical protein
MNVEPVIDPRSASVERCLPYRSRAFPTTRATLVCHARDSAQRPHVEEFVRNEFLVHFKANVKQFMPVLLALHEPNGEPRAVVGCRPAAHERLFLETYTGAAIEQLLAQRLGVDVGRQEIVEIGGLACRGGRAAVEIVKAVVPVLLDAGFSWVVFTAANTVMSVFRHLRLAPHVLCAADQALLGAERHDWGTYYEHNPRVMAGRLRDGLQACSAPGAPYDARY